MEKQIAAMEQRSHEASDKLNEHELELHRLELQKEEDQDKDKTKQDVSKGEDLDCLHQERALVPAVKKVATKDGNRDLFQTKVISWHPRIVLYRKFLADDEAQHILELVNGTLSRSKVVSQTEAVSAGRTSHGQFLSDKYRSKV